MMVKQETIFSLIRSYTISLQGKNIPNAIPSFGDCISALRIKDAYYQCIKNDIQAVICDVLNVDKTYLYIYGDRCLIGQEVAQIDEKMIRYRNGEPLAYLLGYKYFWDQKLEVTQDTLIPRSDTEVLIQAVLDNILRKNIELRILDLGTGTGAIALALAGELINAKVVAVDFSVKALKVAKHNAISNNISNVVFIQSDWYENLRGMKFDIIVSNPPYIDINDNDIDSEVKAYEPALGLFANNNGLADIEKIIAQAEGFLVQNGILYIEHGYTQLLSVHAVFKKYGFVGVKNIQDLNGRNRCSSGVIIS